MKIEKDIDVPEDLESYQKRMTWIVSSNDISEEEIDEALCNALNLDKNAKLTDKIIINQVRKSQNWKEEDRNVAFVKFNYKFPKEIIQKGYILALRGKQFIPGTVMMEPKDKKSEIIIDPFAPISKIFPVQETNEEDEFWYHSIRKLIVTMAKLWELNKLKEGKVLLVSEGRICSSCKNIISIFKNRYPNVKDLEVRENIKDN
ncbi:MAG: deaminase domain-containing protein [Promethearchaeota archaeon]